MKAEHTLGPWDVSKKFPTHIYKWIDGNTFRIVATCDSHGKDEQAQADARLIAAAPDLLNALEQMMISLNKSSCGWNMDSDIERAYSLCKEAYLKSTGP